MASEVSDLQTNLEDAQLFQIPDTKTVLWDHRCNGVRSKLQFAIRRQPRVNIKESILQDAVRFLESVPEGVALCNFVGPLKYSEGSITLNLKTFRERFQYPGIENVSVPILISRQSKDDIKRKSVAYLKDLRTLYENCQNQACMDGKDFFNWYITCSVWGINCDLKIELISLSSTFTITPLHILPIIASELTEFLSKSKGDIIHTGFVTIDCRKEFILVPEDLETLPFLPLVGIWISGVNSIYHPLIWASCVRYISSSFYQKRLCLPPQPFLLILYQPEQELPEFYDCTGNNGKLFPEYNLYEGVGSVSIPKVPIYDSRSLSVELKEMKDKPIEFEAAVEQIKLHEITPAYPNIVTNLDDEPPSPFAPVPFKESKPEEIMQSMVSDLSIDEFSNLETPAICQNRDFPTNGQIDYFNRLSYNMKFPTEVAHKNAVSGSDCIPVTAHKSIENRTVSAPLQFINTYQGNKMEINCVEQQDHFRYPESSLHSRNMVNQFSCEANLSKGSTVDQNISFSSPVIINHKRGRGRYSDELKHPVHMNHSELPTFPHSITHVQQPLNHPNKLYQTADGDDCVNHWRYQNGIPPVTSHIKDHRHFCPVTDYLTSQKQLNGVGYSPNCLQGYSKQAVFSNRKAVSEDLTLKYAHDLLSEQSVSCSTVQCNIHKNTSRSNSVPHNLMDKKQFEIVPDSQLHNYSNPLFEDDNLPAAPKITFSTKNSHTSNASSIGVAASQPQRLAETPPCTTSYQNSLNVSNKSIVQNVNTSMPKKSCLKKMQSPKFSSCDSANASLQSNSSYVTWKETSESVKETAKPSVAIEKNVNHSKIPVNNRRTANKSVNKNQKQDLIQKNEKTLQKKTEIITKPSNQIRGKPSCSQNSKSVTKINAKSSSNQQYHTASEEKNSAAKSAAIMTTDEAGLETEPSKSDEPMLHKECIPFSDSNTSVALTFNTTSVENKSSLAFYNVLCQSLRKQEDITESIKEIERKTDEKFESLENRLQLLQHSLEKTSIMSPTDKTPATRDISHNNKLKDQILDQNINSETECYIPPKSTKHSTPNCSDPKSLPQISMSAVNGGGSVENSPNLCSNDFVVAQQTVTLIKKTCTVSTMTSFVILTPNTETHTETKSHPLYNQPEKTPINTKTEAEVPSTSRTKICTNEAPTLKNRNVLKARYHLSDSEMSKIKHRMDYDKNTQHFKNSPCFDNPRTSSVQQAADFKLPPVKFEKNDNNQFIQKDAKRKHLGLQNTVGSMEHMFNTNHRSLPNPPSENYEKQSKKRLSNSGKHEDLRIPKSKGSKANAKLFRNKLTCPSPQVPSPGNDENSELKLKREISKLKKDPRKNHLKDSYSETSSHLTKYALSPSKISIATKQHLDKYGLYLDEEESSSDFSDS